jgi:cytoskeleton protein RodZ
MTETQAAGLGAEMRAARQAQGWELPQLAASLRIRQSYLEAIEAGRIGDLPGTTYALGFVRAYASALGLPGEEMAKRFRADATLANGQTALRFPAPVPQRGVPAGALMLLGVVILAGAYGGWYWVTEHRATPVETVPPIPDRMVTETQKPLPSPQVASLLPATAPPAANAVPNAPPAAGAAPQTVPATSSTSAVNPASGGQVPPGVHAAPAPVAASNQGNPAAAGQTVPDHTAPSVSDTSAQPARPLPISPPATAAIGRIIIKANADAWLTVKQKGGPPLLNKLMHAGDTWTVPADKDGLTLTTGNAGGTEIDVDGAAIPATLGGSGAVRRDLPLDAEMLKSGKLPPLPARTRTKAVQGAGD